MSGGRTFAIGDIHGDLRALEAVLAKLPSPGAGDTLVFLGDYLDRGPDSRGVVERVRQVAAEGAFETVCLRGNHEDMWIRCFDEVELGFLLPAGNGCVACYRSFAGLPPVADPLAFSREDMAAMIDIKAWMPADVRDWLSALPLWYEDEHAIYVHAGLEGEGTEWKHPRDSAPRCLLWMREPDFYAGYHGKRLVFGHTPVFELPLDHLGPLAKKLDDRRDAWRHRDLIGIDTGASKGGFLTALELPSGYLYESRDR